MRRRVEFYDTDMAGIMHFTAFFRLMEAAEHEFLRARGLSIVSEDPQGQISWPRVAASCEFREAARFEDKLDVEVRIAELGEKSVTYQFAVTRDGRPLAEGRMTSVCCRIVLGSRPKSIPIPDEMREKLEAAAS